MGRALDSFMDWMMEGSMPVAMLKMTAATAVLAGVIMSPFIYIGYQNSEDLDRRFKALDQGARVEFNSVAACTGRGYSQTACTKAQKEAVDIAGALGTAASYSSEQNCYTNHGTCSSQSSMIPITTYVNNMPITTYVHSTTYHPDVLGWQATRSDLEHAVPLYRSAQPGKLMRGDGKLFAAPQP